ncbi:melanoma-associated antigen 8-like [Eubalaena glacialis]|uniref:melanoma-associated antigen 8-like n=1 Tax=Eubalaena glacialis TaxID=27606 RepID=UPI002A5AFF5E|nr:melanoma-associated antigen 8-like [Eubalaena glacialis]
MSVLGDSRQGSQAEQPCSFPAWGSQEGGGLGLKVAGIERGEDLALRGPVSCEERGGGPGPARHPEEDLEARGEDLGLVGVPEFSSGRSTACCQVSRALREDLLDLPPWERGSQGGEGLGVSEKTGQLKESRQVRRKKSPKLYQSQSKDPWNVTSCLRLAEAQEERAQASLEERPVGSHLPPSCLHFYLLPPTRVIMPRSPKHLRLTFEPGFQTLSDVQGLLIVQVPTAEEEEEEETASSPQSSFSSMSWSTSDRSSSIQEEEGTRSLQASVDTRSLLRELQDEKVADLLHFMVLKYRLKEPFTKAEMLKVVSKKYKNQFSVIFKKASKRLEVISGIDVKEVDPKIHSYVLVNSLDLTHGEMLSDDQSMPKNGLLVIILGVIFIEGNCAPEENIWDFLNMLGVYAGRKHFIFGEPRKLITRDWVQENYLEYRKVPNSDPPRYEFLWGPRAYAETSKLKVLEFLAKIKGTDPISFSYWYEEALRDDEESRGHSWPLG